jgi:hypothetical protein
MVRVCILVPFSLIAAATGCGFSERDGHVHPTSRGRVPAMVSIREPSDASGDVDCGRVRNVFLFIGDGMATVQVYATETYLAQLQADDYEPGS